MRRSVFFLVLLSLAFTAQAQSSSGKVYSWKDAAGNTHYGDAVSAPLSAREQKIKVDEASSSTSSSETSSYSPPPGAETSSAAVNANENQACKTARSNVALLSNPANKAVDHAGGDPNADLVVLSDEEKSSRLELAQAAAKVYCGP